MLNRLVDRHAYNNTRGIDLVLTSEGIKVSYVELDIDGNWISDIQVFVTDSWSEAKSLFEKLKSSSRSRARLI